MTDSLLRSPGAQEFRAVASQYCALIDRRGDYSAAGLLTAVEPLLAQLYHTAALLPDEDPTSEHIQERKVSVDEVREIHHSLCAILGPHDEYWELFDPVESADRSPVGGLLSGDLAEIYLDLRNALALVDPGRAIAPADILWEWRFGFTSHWGRHAASALRVVNSLLHTHFVQALSDSPDA